MIYLLLTNGFRNFSFFFFFPMYLPFSSIPENYPEDSILDLLEICETMWFLYCTQPVQKLTLSYISHDKAFPFVIDDLFLLIRSGMLIAKTLNRLFADISVFSIFSGSFLCLLMFSAHLNDQLTLFHVFHRRRGTINELVSHHLSSLT